MPTSKPRRSKRDPDVRQRLNQIRDLMKVRRAEARHREAATTEAVTTYLLAAGSIRECGAERDRHIDELRTRIERVEREHSADVARWYAQQAQAVAAIRDLGETDEGIGELLKLTTKQVRHLLALERKTRATVIDAGVPGGGSSKSGPGWTADKTQAGAPRLDLSERNSPTGQSLA